MVDFIKQFNWVDLFILILGLRICYIALNKGIVGEFFKLLGAISALYLAMHYYCTWARVASEGAGLQNIPTSILEFVCFIILAGLGYGVFIFARLAAGKFVQTEALPLMDRWGGLAMGVARCVVISATLMFLLLVTGSGYLLASVEKSILGRQAFYLSADMYSNLWNGLISKLTPQEQFNKRVEEIKESLKP